MSGGSFDLNCNNLDENSYIGKFFSSWDGQGSTITRLSDHLLNGFDTDPESIPGTLYIDGSGVIPCANLEQTYSVPLFQTNAGTSYTYSNWTSSANITMIPNIGGRTGRFKANTSKPAGTQEWIQVEVHTPSACGSTTLVAKAKRYLTWTSSSDAGIKVGFGSGPNLPTFNYVCTGQWSTLTPGFLGIPTPPGVTFAWTLNGSNVQTATGPGGAYFDIRANTNTSFSVTVQVIGGAGCISGATRNIVFQSYSCFNGETTPSELIELTDGTEARKPAFSYPDALPAQLFTLQGKLIGPDVEETRRTLANGLYLLHAQSPDGAAIKVSKVFISNL